MIITISINDELMERIDEYVDNNYTNRSSFFAQSALKKIKEYELIRDIKMLELNILRINESNEISCDDKRKMIRLYDEIMYLYNKDKKK